jgi:hypothetical protein
VIFDQDGVMLIQEMDSDGEIMGFTLYIGGKPSGNFGPNQRIEALSEAREAVRRMSPKP